MKKIFLFAAAVLCSAAMFAEEITSVNVTIESFPKVGDNIKPGEFYNPSDPDFNTVCKVTIPDGVNYYLSSYLFYDTTGDFPAESTFISGKTYWVEVDLYANDGFSFPVDGEGNADLTKVTITATGGTDFGMGGNAEYVYCMREFVPSSATAIDNTAVDAKAVKRVVNGQLFIERDGKTFNAQGIEVK